MTARSADERPALSLTEVVKRFGATEALGGVSLDLGPGELLALVGPSGCGKSTLLRIVAGLLAADGGRVQLGGQVVDDGRTVLPPERRRIGLVFQEHALFPHLTVARNVAFGLRGLDRRARRARVATVLDLVGLGILQDRYPHELSGGERQRVALARALAPEPELLLLDEPFASLDPNLRTQIRVDVVSILHRTATPAVFVTHDQGEALAVGDQVAVIRDGRLEQVGRPWDVFHHPANTFVAAFMGEASFLPIGHTAGGAATELGPLDGPAVGGVGAARSPAADGTVAMVRPDDLTFRPDPAGTAEVVAVEFRGASWSYDLRLASGAVVRSSRSHLVQARVGDRVAVAVSEGHHPVIVPRFAMTSAEVVVVGGGPAGLAAALAAARQGRSVELVEAADGLGGMAASFEVAGQRVDLGSHRLHPSAPPAVAALLDELLGDDLQVRLRRGRLRLRDRWVGFPLEAGDLVRSLPPSFALAAGRDAVGRPLRRPRGDTYAEVVRVGLGPTVLRDFHGPMAAKLWGTDPRRLAGELARRRIPVRGPSSLAAKLVHGARPAGRTFRYPRLGYGQVVDRLVDAAEAAGVGLRTATTIGRVGPAGGGSNHLDLGPAGTLEAGRILWTAPLGPLVAALDDGAPGLAHGTRHRGLALVYLVVPRPRYSAVDAHYVPDPDVAFARLSEPKNYRDGPDPGDVTVLCAEVPCTAGDATWNRSDGDLAALVLDGMARCGLAVPPVLEVVVRRLSHVYPVFGLDEVPARRRLLAWADSRPGISVLGRQGLLVADNLHHVLDMALTAAGCAGPDGRWDDRAWAQARARFDGFVVDD